MLRLVVTSARIPAPQLTGADVHVRAEFRGVPRSTRVVPGKSQTVWNEWPVPILAGRYLVQTLVWPLGPRPLDTTSEVLLRLRQWGHPAPDGELGAAAVALGRLAAEPSSELALSAVPLLTHERQPTGVSAFLPSPLLIVTVPRARRPRDGPDRSTHPSPAAGKKQDFQVRVRIIEGRQLQGNDIRPVVKVLIGEHAFRTRIRSGNNPYYDEVFCQNLRRTLARLLDEPILIQVLNSKAMRAESLIGVFKLDVGSVYSAPGRALAWKWLSLHQPEHPNAGVRGYLRASLWVLRAGEPAPELEALPPSEDVEGNLLQPVALPGRVATLQLRVYRAEDVPQEDSSRPHFPPMLPGSKRNSLSVEATFAGRTLHTRAVLPTANPEWNEVLFFPLRVSRVTLPGDTAGDRMGKGDVLGMATLRLSQVSSAGTELEGGGSGFLPCFGPSFLPLYGSVATRLLPAWRPSTSGPACGTTYRGRVLLELSTSTERPGERERDAVAPEDVARLERFLRRRTYGLCAVFASATMLPRWDELLQVEVSVGHYGNRAEGSCRAAASATPHARPVYDGNRYCYLPWFDTKPVVAFTSSWEDVSERCEALNALQALHDRLEHNLASLRRLLDRDADADEAGKRLLRELLEDCNITWAPFTVPVHPSITRAPLTNLIHPSITQGPVAILVHPSLTWALFTVLVHPSITRGPFTIPVHPSITQAPFANLVHPSITWALFTNLVHSRCHPLCHADIARVPREQGEPEAVCAQLRVRLWLALAAEGTELARHLEGALQVHAETYENQLKLLGKWGTRGLVARPVFSDVTGKVALPRDKLRPPRGWRWDGEWRVEPQRRLLLDTETNVAKVLEEVYENQSRRPGGDWAPAAVPHTDAAGSPVPPKEQVPCPAGWQVTEGWHVEVTGAVDDAGWEYGVSVTVGRPPPAWHPAEKTYHTRRRRRWLGRHLAGPSYFQLRCYIFQAMDLAPRGAKDTADAVAHVSFVHLSQSTRVLEGTLEPRWDQTLLFERVLLHGDPQGARAEPPPVVVEVFDQDGGGAGTFLGRGVCRPAVCLDVGRRRLPRLQRFPLGGPAGAAGELLAAFELLHDTEDGSLAQLQPPPWRAGTFSIPAGIRPALRLVALEVLAWGLRRLRGPPPLPVRAPSLLLECGGHALRTPPIADLRANPNFPVNAFLLTLHLPVEEDYVPPIKLRVLDTWDFGYRPELGRASVRSLRQYCCEPAAPGAPAALPGPAAPQGWIAQLLARITAEMGAGHKEEEEEEEEEEGDWWSKFYAATGDAAKRRRGPARDALTVYSSELEAVPEFEGLQDFCQTFPLYRGAGTPEGGEDPVGEFKGLFRIYPLPEDPGVPRPPRHFQELPPSEPQQCLVRLYVIRAFNLPPRDRNGLCDPYVRVSLGTKKAGDRDQYVPNTLEPVFGRLFEVTATIPLEKDLQISLFDYDLLPPDQEIGSTSIDLENRLLSRYRAHCGLPQLYHVAGPRRWRDQLTPSRALERLARARGLPAPQFSADGTAVIFGGATFLLGHFESGPPTYRHPGAPRERLALHLLHACRLVPEHLETRTLYSSTQPGLEQGKLQLWVDIFPASLGPPGPPTDVTPRQPQSYELRCVVWNTRDVDLQDTSLAGQRTSDIYVKGWLAGLEEQAQRTDVHYRSLQGDGSFNWRFVFPFNYLPAEQLCVLPRKEHFWSLDETVHKVPPKLILQVWDNDKFSADDFLGVLELELLSLPQPAPRPGRCSLAQLGPPPRWPRWGGRAPRVSLFRQRRARGWWPCSAQEGGKRRLAGKLELSLELLAAAEAAERPAGKGREEPNAFPRLAAPLRPDCSWLQAPLRTLRYALRWRHRRALPAALALALLLALLLAFVYAAPGYLAMKLVDPLQGWHPGGGATRGRRPRR
ncbi:fer-1-like protein 5 [Nothoprocta perdicaria]|uniref:fer-1-like protein 5 n=1 Tax=Nothoprocta perdicaria TaxID=30464 RepID=UPI000E1BA933|nr:fer-1-like protein 5 [Nothoprocta perdicaria]